MNNTPLTVDKLLVMYDDYKTLLTEQKQAEAKAARARLLDNNTADTEAELAQLAARLQQLSDNMTFDTPHIWIGYKYRAYRHDPQPITTMHDLHLHCSKPDYICTKRFTFLNHELERVGQASLNDRIAYPDAMNISKLLDSSTLDTLSADFETTWRSYEYYRDKSGKPAKWQSYRP